MVVRVHENTPQGVAVRDILHVIDSTPMLLPEQYRLWAWISDYYMSPIGDVYRSAMPTGLKSLGSYKPKTETYIRLTEGYRNEKALHEALNQLVRARKQLEVFTAYLAISHWDEGKPIEISREALLNETHCNTALITALCQRGMLETYEHEVGRLNGGGEPHPENIKPLNPYQQEAYNNIYKEWEEKNVCLLHGVTSSGKTEIYISMIQRAIDEGKQVLYLLPEIALTVQITQRLQRVFGRRIGIYHSKYSDAERVEIWQKQLSDEPFDIILGARSALFLPFKKLGLVIVDEEHETSFKQQDPAPRYHGRSTATVLAQMYGAKTLLGTATPSIESYYNACPPTGMKAKYGYVTLTKRHNDMMLPEIKVVDTKDLRRRKMMTGVLSPQLREAIATALDAGEQVILFQNRRGFSPIIECRQCAWTPHCPNCDVSLTYHKNINNLSCHYCGYTMRMPSGCPECGKENLYDRGFGTEKVEDIIQQEFPKAKIARMDLDTTRTRNAYERIISDFSSHKTNILIGTQMVTKGLDFDNVSVVGILSADSMLNQPDFRAWEHAYTMMTQVAGRAGRSARKGIAETKRGTVIMQTANPTLPVIRQIVAGDFKGFTDDLLDERELFHYPPFTRLIYIYLRHTENNVVESAGIELASRLRNAPLFMQNKDKLRVLGPDKPAVARVKTLCIRKIMVKVDATMPLNYVRATMRNAVSQLMKNAHNKSLQAYFDVDPV